MSDYVKSTDFASKDTLPSGDSAKIVRGTEIDAEFEALEVAIASKANTSDVSSTYAPLNSPTFTGSPVLPTGTTAVTQAAGDNDTSVATTAFVTTAVTALGYPSFKNRIINGAMVIDQRNAGASVTPSNAAAAFATDRFAVSVSQNSKCTIQQNAGSVTPPAGYSKYLGFTVGAAAGVTVGAGDYFLIQQRIEGNNLADMGFGAAGASTFTISFWVRSSVTGTFGFALQNGGQTRSYATTYTINAANTWEQKTITVVGDTSGTWATDNTGGLYCSWGLGVGATYSIAAGSSWSTTTSPNGFGVTGTVQLIQTNGATFYITGVQLEKGSTATSFDYRPYGTELALCQRYYQTSTNSVMGAWTTGAALFLCNYANFVVPMRATPTATQPSSFAIQGITASATGFTVSAGSSTMWTFASTSANGQGDGVCRQVSPGSVLTFNAEL